MELNVQDNKPMETQHFIGNERTKNFRIPVINFEKIDPAL